MDDAFLPSNITEREIAIRRRVHRLAEFYRHALLFIVLIGAMWAINAWQICTTDYSSSIKWYSWWAIWPTAGWGIGLISHAITVIPRWTFFSAEGEDRKVKELLEQDKS